MEALFLTFLVAASGACAYAFWRPRGAFRFAGIAALAAVVAPFAVAMVISPFLGSGAGMGVAFILVALSALTGTIALFAAIGAGARYAWSALR